MGRSKVRTGGGETDCHSSCLSSACAALDLLLEHEGVEAALESILVLLPLKLCLVLALELGSQVLGVPASPTLSVSND